MKTKVSKKTKKHKATSACNKIKNVTIILLYHTFAARMKSFGPTALIPFKRRALIDKQIDSINRVFYKSKIIIAAGYGAYDIYKYVTQKYPENDIRLVENSNFNQSSSSETLSLALNNTNASNVLILDGSLIIGVNSFKKLNFNKNCTLFYKKNNSSEDAGLNINENNLVEHFAFGASRGWSEALFLKYKRDINHLRDSLANPLNRKKFIFEVLNSIISSKNVKIHGIPQTSEMVKINSLYVYKEIERTK